MEENEVSETCFLKKRSLHQLVFLTPIGVIWLVVNNETGNAGVKFVYLEKARPEGYLISVGTDTSTGFSFKNAERDVNTIGSF